MIEVRDIKMIAKMTKYIVIPATAIAIGSYVYYKFIGEKNQSTFDKKKNLLLKMLRQWQRHVYSIVNYFSFLYRANIEEDSVGLDPKEKLLYLNYKSTSLF